MATHFKGPVVSENGFEGAFTGNITGNITGNVTGNVTGNLVGNQSGGSVAATTATASTSLAVGSGGVAIKAIKSGTVSLDPGALAATDEIDLPAAITGVAAGDMVAVIPPAAAAEAGLAVALVWVSAPAQITVRISILNTAAALAGGAQLWTYLWYDLT